MNISLLETARHNRTTALAYLRIKQQVNKEKGQLLSLQTIREKMETKPIFRTVRVHRFEERLAA